VKKGAAACAILLFVGVVVDTLGMYYIPQGVLNSFWIGRPGEGSPIHSLMASSIMSGLCMCTVPFCMYYGAVKESKCCLGCAGMFTCSFFLLLLVAFLPTAHFMASVPELAKGLDDMAEYYETCDPKVCCGVAVTESAVNGGTPQPIACKPDFEGGEPYKQYHKAYLDCLLGADKDYEPDHKVNERKVYLPQDCKFSLLYLTDCEGRFDEEFLVYTNNWAYDMKEALNSSMEDEGLAPMPPILIGEEDQKGPWKRYPTSPGWKPGMPLDPEVEEEAKEVGKALGMESAERRRADEVENAAEEVDKEALNDVSKDGEAWEKFGEDLEKFDWSKLESNPKNPGEYSFKSLFKSDLENCGLRMEALSDASAASTDYVPGLKHALRFYVTASFFVVLFGICISGYACVNTCTLCIFGKPEMQYDIIDQPANRGSMIA